MKLSENTFRKITKLVHMHIKSQYLYIKQKLPLSCYYYTGQPLTQTMFIAELSGLKLSVVVYF